MYVGNIQKRAAAVNVMLLDDENGSKKNPHFLGLSLRDLFQLLLKEVRDISFFT